MLLEKIGTFIFDIWSDTAHSFQSNYRFNNFSETNGGKIDSIEIEELSFPLLSHRAGKSGIMSKISFSNKDNNLEFDCKIHFMYRL